jgi:hypothetical protein
MAMLQPESSPDKGFPGEKRYCISPQIQEKKLARPAGWHILLLVIIVSVLCIVEVGVVA